MAKVTRETPNPPGGTFDREATKPRPTATVFEAEVGDNSKSRMASRSMPRGM